MIYAFGDIHGQSLMLQVALDYLCDNLLQPEDTVVFIGDYIDRGLYTKDVINSLRVFSATHKRTIFLRGNHEEMFLLAYGHDDHAERVWVTNGGFETLASYGTYWSRSWRDSIPAEDVEFIVKTQMEYVTDHYHFVHAGLLPSPGNADKGEADHARLWIREEFMESIQDFGRVVVFGHTPQRAGEPFVMFNKVGIDTAAAFDGLLSVAGFDDTKEHPGIQPPPFTLFQVDTGGIVHVNNAYYYETAGAELAA